MVEFGMWSLVNLVSKFCFAIYIDLDHTDGYLNFNFFTCVMERIWST